MPSTENTESSNPKKGSSSSAKKELLHKGLASFLGRGLLPRILDAMRSYTRLTTEGIEHIPRTGSTLIIPNHSGVWGWDAMVLQNEILKKIHRIPRTMLHDFWFRNENLREIAVQLAFIPQDFKKALRILKRNNLLLVFPEAEAGNFKPSHQMYHIQDFNPGFVSLAMLSKATIIPCCILGAEESHLNLGTLSWAEKWFGAKIPLPINILPFPVKWKIIFLPPIKLDMYNRKNARNEKFLIEVAENIRMRIQQKIQKELVKRKVSSFLWDS